MITVTHLLDDPALGGVTRFLDALESGLGIAVAQRCVVVDPRMKVAPSIDGDVIVIHFTANWAKMPFLLSLRARHRLQSIVLVEHGYSEAYERRNVPSARRFRMMLRMAYRLADRVVAVSYAQAAWLRRAHTLSADKLVVISPFTACGNLAALPLPERCDGPLLLGAYGRYCAQKDFGTLIEAMRSVDPAVAHLSLRGFGPDDAALRAQARGMPHVSVGGPVDDLAGFLGGLEAVAIPSCYEPFGQVALEARLAARPLIVTDVDGLPEQVEPDAGWIVPPGSPTALAEAIRDLSLAKSAGALPGLAQDARASAAGHIETGTRRWLAMLQMLPSVAKIERRAGAAIGPGAHEIARAS